MRKANSGDSLNCLSKTSVEAQPLSADLLTSEDSIGASSFWQLNNIDNTTTDKINFFIKDLIKVI